MRYPTTTEFISHLAAIPEPCTKTSNPIQSLTTSRLGMRFAQGSSDRQPPVFPDESVTFIRGRMAGVLAAGTCNVEIETDNPRPDRDS
jgi:hypothetical protein